MACRIPLLKTWILCIGLTLTATAPGWCLQATPALTVAEILDGIERAYSGEGFSAAFDQEATIKAMQITDTAQGQLFVRRPGKMRWEYTAPEPQIIITDGASLWVYRPLDKQVMTGTAPAFFGDGRGAGFLADIRQVRQGFTVTQEPTEMAGEYRLRLIPRETTPDVTAVHLSISADTFIITDVLTVNAYGDETWIQLKDYRFNQRFENEVFAFDIPPGTDVLKLNDP
ncbi:MAG: outer membrane lipoprotein carrier protein LolA [Desulfosarcinaceae bacterium]|nr:outer membrane lipoprotein carrier protein LolA [Desulfosarcinaceae bacterium]